MEYQIRVLGETFEWWVCPGCGIRVEYEYEPVDFEYIEHIHMMNQTGGKHELNK